MSWDAPSSEVAIDGIRVLVADDNSAAREIARKILQSSGAQVFEASNGKEAAAIASAQPFDVILLDIRMPEMNGFEVANMLRTQRGPNRNAAIVAFTADSDGSDPLKFEAQGFDAVLLKPVIASDMLAVVQDLCGQAGSGG